MSGLLVSVRSAEEALAALEGGADLIDVKEPARGPLGRADADVIAAVVRAVAGRRPVSAALGELSDPEDTSPLPLGLSFVKWGLATLRGLDWRRRLIDAAARLDGPRPVFTAYADAEEAQSPPVAEIVAFAGERSESGVVLIDTFAKDGRTLLDHLDVGHLARLIGECRRLRVRVALAGSLGPPEIERLRPLAPEWFAVRGAACEGGDRGGSVRAERVRRLASLLAAAR